jgi:hypothetical protein
MSGYGGHLPFAVVADRSARPDFSRRRCHAFSRRFRRHQLGRRGFRAIELVDHIDKPPQQWRRRARRAIISQLSASRAAIGRLNTPGIAMQV